MTQAVERSNQECPICLTSLQAASTTPEKSAPDPSPEQGAGDSKSKASAQPPAAKGAAAARKLDKSQPTKSRGQVASGRAAAAQPRDDGATKRSSEEGAERSERSGNKGGKLRRTVLLSCTHVFHETCLQTLEELAMGDIRNSCPICRAVYQKRVVTL